MTTRDRVRGAIYGHLVGDALGVPYEFTHHIETVEWSGHGSHNQPAGTWSDDGALMLALLDSLLDADFDTADQARRCLDWRDHKKYTPDWDGPFDIGNATGMALARVKDGVPAEEAGDDPNALRQRVAHAHPAHRPGRPERLDIRAGGSSASVQSHHAWRSGVPGCLRPLRACRA